MRMQLAIACVLATAGSARADHSHGVDDAPHANAWGASVAMIAASYETMFYAGNYQGVVPGVKWTAERLSAGANVAAYRLEKNGAAIYGFGDAVVHGQVTVAGERRARAGGVAALSIPLADDRRGISMGHVMAMPALFGAWSTPRVSLAATAGYSRALGGSGHAAHGDAMWPLVEPMNLSELTWSGAGDVAVTRAVHAGARVSGGVPLGDGVHRVAAGLRVAWATGRFSTAAELHAGLAGDPFTLRGVLSTAMTF